ncbi:CTP synthetase [Roseovarius sp. LXJ103]|uniref:CTP synthetase n=1 Tax=Roseovarius carneus TaxID=2853164 RepID=UPI000D6130B8|nr:CTP synthetase [Roseovarius carneus]MBZ8117105.1 CTP synthetase [Roseovarius carneus]PWE37050.1 CTP synthetase [Pelagicola sp. LXJ1103]
MFWLTFTLHLFIGSTLAGTAIIAALVMGYDTVSNLLIAAGAGFVLAVPASVMLAKTLTKLR